MYVLYIHNYILVAYTLLSEPPPTQRVRDYSRISLPPYCGDDTLLDTHSSFRSGPCPIIPPSITMDGLSIAASVFAVIDLSTKVASLLFQYSKDVWNAKEAITRLQQEVSNLKNATESVQQLLKGPNGTKLKSSQKLLVALGDSLSQLGRMEKILDPGRARKAMRHVGLRAFKWPSRAKTPKGWSKILRGAPKPFP